MSKKAKLKPCPFCGSTQVKIDTGEASTSEKPAYVFCKECVAIGPSAKTPFEAVYYWNYREENPDQVERLMNIRQVCNCLGLSRATVYRLIQDGKFPKPLNPLGTKAARWTPQDVEQYKDLSQKEERFKLN